MTEPRTLARAVTVLVAVVAVLLPATAAHASLPSDMSSGSRQSVQPSDDTGAIDGDDEWYEDLGEAADDEGDDGAADDADAGSDDGSDASQQVGPTRPAPRTRPGRPRAVSADAVSTGRATVRWTAGRGAKATRFMVSLQSASTGRMRFVRGASRTVTFAALQARTRYTVTVTAVGAYGTASASTTFRTAAPKRTTSGKRTTVPENRSARDARVAKAIRFA